ncbi:unnamed protein product [Hymenolepis diminuta]|uniref:Ovule protein n=1 Tax=Hymenolepis diminuta TaxID=6216 RepID=A0A0R3SUK6_HYMDI|nr:unnamed protein product [Hymenolepis diminuta]
MAIQSSIFMLVSSSHQANKIMFNLSPLLLYNFGTLLQILIRFMNILICLRTFLISISDFYVDKLLMAPILAVTFVKPIHIKSNRKK